MHFQVVRVIHVWQLTDPSSAETGLFRVNYAIIMAADILAPILVKSSTIMTLIMLDKLVPAFHEKDFSHIRLLGDAK